MSKNPQFIRNWKELSEVPPSDTHYILIDTGYSGWVRSIANDGKRPVYLSTHTFYDKGQNLKSTALLQSLGFNVELDDWDNKRPY
tara:strand:+ start:411 stop:665 length:255 start_codon:yes stop_codon:yes gene_type:complete